MVILTVGVLCQDGISCEEWLGLSFLVDGRNLEHVEVAGLQAGGGGAGGLGGAGSDPLPAVDVHVPDQVACDGSPSVVLWRGPAQLDVLRSHLIHVHVAGLAGDVQHVHVGRGLEGSRLADQLDGVAACVSSSVSLEDSIIRELSEWGETYLWNAHDCVPLCVNCILRVKFNRSVIIAT